MIKLITNLLEKIIIFLKKFFIDTKDIDYNYNSEFYTIHKKTQKELVLNHFKEHGHITVEEAFELYEASRMSAIVYNLRKEGYVIVTERVGKNKYVYKYLGN
jgi:predicted transcriptional regulator of viral defense system